MAQDSEISLKSHLLELRNRLIVSALALVLGTIVAFLFHQYIFEFLMVPARGFESIDGNKLIFTQITEMLGITMKISILGGFVIASPVLLYQVVMFVSPGLTKREKRFLLLLAPGGTICFIAGMAFGYFVLLPPGLKFLLTFGSDIASPMIRIGNYVNLVTRLLFWLGVAFETPLVMFFLSKIGIVRPDSFARGRRYSVVVAFILGALITPTFDPVNQTLVAVPIILLYETGIWLAKLGGRGKHVAGVDIKTRE
ncbi:MAG: twin-arginine translocase subunit TatC [Dehalococcoidia bacterium]|nr:twin-arginine translocase subunit TatC [Dehalococcoidia bacterium]